MSTHVTAELMLSQTVKNIDVIVAVQPIDKDRDAASVMLVIDEIPTLTLAGYAQDIETIMEHALASLKAARQKNVDIQQQMKDGRN